jgi:putative glutamine amidotransferase
MTVNSFHHQAVKKIPFGARVFARTKEGSIEAVSFSEKHFKIGVQWHPERQKDECAKRLFCALVEAAC